MTKCSEGGTLLDGKVARATLMDPGTAQVTPLELCTALHDAATAAGATTVYGEVMGVNLVRKALAASSTTPHHIVLVILTKY